MKFIGWDDDLVLGLKKKFFQFNPILVVIALWEDGPVLGLKGKFFQSNPIHVKRKKERKKEIS